MRALVSWALAGIWLWGALPARAESDADLEWAKALFDEGRLAMSEQKFDEACDAFERSLARARGIGTRFNLADCEEHRGRYGRARALFVEVAQLSREAGQPERESVARARAAALDARLAQLQLTLESKSGTLTLDGKEVALDSLGEPLLVEPGEHRVVLSAPGKKTLVRSIAVPKAGLLVIVDLPALEAEPAPPAASAPERPAERAEPKPERVASVHTDGGRDARRVALVLGGVGLGATVAGIAFGAQYLSNNHDAKNVCPTSYGCSEDDISAHARYLDDAKTARTWSYVGFGVGAAALTSALVLYLGSHRQSVSTSASIGPGGSWRVGVQAPF